MSAISHPVQLLPSSWSRWFHKMSKCFSVKTWLSLLVLMIQWGAFDECVCSSSQWMLGLVPYVERPFVCCFLNSVFCVFFIYLFLPPLSKLTEEQGKLFSPLLENCASSEGCSFSWRRGSSSLPWECQDHSEKRALSYLFGSHAQTHTSTCADRQGCKNIHHREIQSFSGLKNILELCDGGPVRRIQEANLTQKNHATWVPRCEHF